MLLDDATGAGFVLLIATPDLLNGLDARQRGTLDRVGVSTFVIGDTAGPMPALNDVEGRLGAWFAQHSAAAVLLRPDRYVFGIAANTAELARLSTQLGAALAPS
jgi:3-(3-hydroxy-phenyl)propionate hydroxylase